MTRTIKAKCAGGILSLLNWETDVLDRIDEGKLFQKIIKRGKNLEKVDIFVQTGQESVRPFRKR